MGFGSEYVANDLEVGLAELPAMPRNFLAWKLVVNHQMAEFMDHYWLVASPPRQRDSEGAGCKCMTGASTGTDLQTTTECGRCAREPTLECPTFHDRHYEFVTVCDGLVLIAECVWAKDVFGLVDLRPLGVTQVAVLGVLGGRH